MSPFESRTTKSSFKSWFRWSAFSTIFCRHSSATFSVNFPVFNRDRSLATYSKMGAIISPFLTKFFFYSYKTWSFPLDSWYVIFQIQPLTLWSGIVNRRSPLNNWAVGRFENLGVLYYLVVEIRLTDLPKSGDTPSTPRDDTPE